MTGSVHSGMRHKEVTASAEREVTLLHRDYLF
jgi:hypothetical protein